MYSESFDLSTLPDSLTEFKNDIFLSPIMPNSLINLKNIFFETDSYVINPKSYTELDNLVSFLKQNTTVALQVEGHTDSVGTYKYNMDLSTKRAKAISDYLVNAGIQQNRITYKGYGFTKPIADNQTEEGRKLNRRTEILILKK
jgi:outer membrane protein OmpA-like peptidoglycan-associated protein